jgi:Fur family transcriptional regulator, ferric uptake regulator
MKKHAHGDSTVMLENHKLRITPIRQQVLGLFMGKPHALSHADIEQTLVGDFDRVTIYRTLTSFVEKGMLHKIPADNGLTRYALCKDECSNEEHHHSHVHFNCNQCSQTFCLENISVPHINLPQGYSFTDMNYIATGTCKNCNKA